MVLVQCRCEQWILDHLEPSERFYSTQCSVCNRLTVWSFEHVGQFPNRDTFVTVDDVNWDHLLHTDDSSICVKRSGEIIEDYQTWYVEPNGRHIREINGRVVTHDQFGVIEHVGDYKNGICRRGIWMHQPSGFLYYRSQTSDLRYLRGIATGRRFHPLLEPDAEVAITSPYERIRSRLLRKFKFNAVKPRERIELYWLPEDRSGTSSCSGNT